MRRRRNCLGRSTMTSLSQLQSASAAPRHAPASAPYLRGRFMMKEWVFNGRCIDVFSKIALGLDAPNRSVRGWFAGHGVVLRWCEC